MSSFNEEQVLENRPNDYQQSVLSVMGITQWQLRSISSDESAEDIADNVELKEDSSDLNNAEQQKKRVAPISALRDAVSGNSNISSNSQITTETTPEKETAPGLKPIFSIATNEEQFVAKVVASVADRVTTSVEWTVTNRLHLSGTKLETQPIAELMNNLEAKKQLWRLLQTIR